MDNYNNNKTKHSEHLACKILNDIGLKCKLNNLDNHSAVDIITNTGRKIDVQYSQDFNKYGDYRLDIISAFKPRDITINNNYIYNQDYNFFKNFTNKFMCEIIKYGKIFQDNYLDSMIILFYNSKYDFNNNPDYILIFNKSNLLSYIEKNPKDLFEKIKINNKYDLNDNFGSAFIPIKADECANITKGFFLLYEELNHYKDSICNYLK